jgi:glycosyltransferase involved in cell wall biosynthesis
MESNMNNSCPQFRLAQIIESTSAGVGRHVADLSECLLDRGHEVHLIYSKARIDNAFQSAIDRLREFNRFHAFELPMRRAPHWSDLAAMVKLRNYVRRNGPFDAVHCHSTKAGIVGRAGLLGCSVKRVYTPHALFTMKKTPGASAFRWVAILAERLLAYACDRIILVSKEELEHARAIGLPAKILDVINPGVPRSDESKPHRDSLRSQEGLGPQDVCIGFVGRLVSQKSPATLLEAFRLLSVQRGVKLAIVGDGPLLQPLRQVARRLGIDDRVSWLGYREGRIAMEMFDVFALTSNYEGFPYTVLEAMAQGLPAVVPAVGGISATVSNGENGFVVAHEAAEFARALTILVDDPDLRLRMGQASLQRVRAFSLDRMIDQTLQMYRNLQHESAEVSSEPSAHVAAPVR